MSWLIYAAPIVLIAAAMVLMARRDARRRARSTQS
jgi:cytochrome c-type biogenesis protein CcmH/NrfF